MSESLNPAGIPIFGSLTLPVPSSLSSAEDLRAMRLLQPKLDAFSKIAATQLPMQLDLEFENFRMLESAMHEPPKPIAEMVRPSGSLGAPIILHLNYPSMTTKHLFNGEVADRTNCCVRMIIDSGFTAENSFWFNTWSRREKRTTRGSKCRLWVAETAYSPPVYQMHLSWSNRLRESASAKVEVVFGTQNRLLMEKQMKGRLEAISLWTSPPVLMHIEYKDESRASISRLIIFVHHPEHFFYNWTTKSTIEMDQALTVAARLAGYDFTCSYFQNRLKRYSNFKFAEELLASSSSGIAEPWLATHGRSAWNVIRDMVALEEDGAVFTFQNLPPCVLEWADRSLSVSNSDELGAKYHEVFWEGGLKRNLGEIRSKWTGQAARLPITHKSRQRAPRCSKKDGQCQAAAVTEESSESVGIAKMLERLSRSNIGARTNQSYKAAKTYAYEEYLIRKPTSSLVVKCERCGATSVDEIVRYWKTHPKFYVAHLTETCCTVGCTGFQRALIPVDVSIPWVMGTAEKLRVKTTTKLTKSSLDDYLSFSHGSLPKSLFVACKTCSGSSTEDQGPRWTAHSPPKYVCPIWTCGSCKKARHFVPVGETAFIYRGSVDRDIKSGKIPPKRSDCQ